MFKNDDLAIELLGLKKHPEGGWFRETYRSSEIIPSNALPERYSEPHSFSTCIYYLLKSGEKSKLHRLKSDEIWHFYSGSPLNLILIDKNGRLSNVVLGQDIGNGEHFHFVVNSGTIMGAFPVDDNASTLVGCTVAPGFEFEDFEMIDRENLIKEFPKHKEIIEEMT